MKCIKCDNELEASVKFCRKCGAEQIKSQVKSEETKSEQKSFKLDMSKEGNRRSLMGIGFLILLKLLGALLGSYLLAGIILGVLFVIIDYSFKKSLTETGKIDKIESLKEKSNNLIEKPVIQIEVEKEKKLNATENKTISHLEDKVWYRTLKVCYLILFVLILICGNIIIFDSIPNNLISPNKITNPVLESTPREKNITSGIINKSSESQRKTGFDFDKLKSEVSQPQASNSIWYFVMNFIIGNLSILLFFEVLRRVFYYIMLGSLRPQK